MDKSLLNDLPEIGFLAFKDNKPIAAGFIRQCEGDYGLIDSFITNPTALPSHRDEALNLVTKQLVIKAKAMRLKMLTAYTTDENTRVRAEKHEFVKLPHSVMVLDLSKKA